MFLIAPGKTRQEQVLEQIVGADAGKGKKQTEFTSFIKEKKKKIFPRDISVTWS